MRTTRKRALITALIMAVLLFILPELKVMLSMLVPSLSTQSNAELKSLIDLPLLLLLPCVLISLIYLRKSGHGFRAFFRLKGFDGVEFLVITAIALSLPLVVNTIIHYSNQLFGASDVMQQVALQPDGSASFVRQAGTFFYTLLLLSIIPAVCEEMFFRGALMSLTAHAGLKTAFRLILSALLFSLFHKNLTQMPYLLMIGLVFSLTAHITDSVPASAYLHALYNFCFVLQFALDARKYPLVASVSRFYTQTNILPLSLGISAAIAAGLYFLYRRGRGRAAPRA